MAPIRKQNSTNHSDTKTVVNPQTNQRLARRKKVKLQHGLPDDASGKTLTGGLIPPDIRVPGYKNGVEKLGQTTSTKQIGQNNKKETFVTTEMPMQTSTISVYGNHTPVNDPTTTMATPKNGDFFEFLVRNATFLLPFIFLIFLMALIGSCCACGPFAWIRRWIRRIFSRRQVVRREKGRITRTDERQRLLNNEQSHLHQHTLQNDVLNSLRRSNNENEEERKRKLREDLEFQENLKEYENSLKPTEEEVQFHEKKDEENKKLQQEIKEIEKNREKMKKKHDSSNSSLAGNFEEVDRADNEFRTKLDEQSRIFEEKMRRLKEKREEKERKNQEEIDRLRFESEQNVSAFLKFIQLRLRFEEKEQEWSESLKKLRKPLASVVNSYYHLQEEIKNGDSSDEFSAAGVRSEGQLFANKVSAAQNMLKLGFDNLEKLTVEFDDRIFIRMIMKSISQQGLICNEVGITLVRVMQSVDQKEELKKMDTVVSQLDPHSIPTTTTLKRTSPSARMEDYLNIERVSTPGWLRYFK
ncbi:hypothetical protein GCK72_018914 [Caenorhabditis remanei]|uniref:Uncharacterized protein n=1 Tax=Caenorhabditis remanei TaxID=31234 RepID=A0A6A5GBB8_CAERE|nr:hypothetical protein GCK72_018914 [Caenorhabditis remanei]KAF1752360.1 hypothetical protein GCK72_018914 [Caenorhabditis remanei]